jgi:hypothetical protein
MSIIAVAWSGCNIAFCGDSRIAFYEKQSDTQPTAWADIGEKVLFLPFARLGIAVAGPYLIGGRFLASHLRDYDARERNECSDPVRFLQSFANDYLTIHCACDCQVMMKLFLVAGRCFGDKCEVACVHRGVVRNVTRVRGVLTNEVSWRSIVSGIFGVSSPAKWVEDYVSSRCLLGKTISGGPVDILTMTREGTVWKARKDNLLPNTISELAAQAADGTVALHRWSSAGRST